MVSPTVSMHNGFKTLNMILQMRYEADKEIFAMSSGKGTASKNFLFFCTRGIDVDGLDIHVSFLTEEFSEPLRACGFITEFRDSLN